MTQRSFKNPVVGNDRPDPGVNNIGGIFYLVSTGKGPNGGAFPLLRSTDLVTWEEIGTVFPPNGHPVWSANTDYWAPEIHQVANGKIHVYFAARDKEGKLHVGVAVADAPEGPYVDPLRTPLVSDPHWAIDASYFLDVETQRQYVLWKIDGNAHGVPSVIKMRELDATGIRFADGAAEHRLLSSDQRWEHGVVEGPWLLKRGTYYYLFYSGGCFAAADYCVCVARATAPTGPYNKCGAPILCSGRGFAGPGHCVVIASPVAGDVMVYHAHRSSRMHQVDAGGRHVLVDRVTWAEDGWPRVGRMCTPTAGEQPHIDVDVAYGGDALSAGASYIFKLCNNELTLQHSGFFGADEALFTVRDGLIPGGTVSLEPTGRPGAFLRHRFGKLACDNDDGSALFKVDATWQVVAGLSHEADNVEGEQAADGRAAISLRSINFPQAYVAWIGILEGADVDDQARIHHLTEMLPLSCMTMRVQPQL